MKCAKCGAPLMAHFRIAHIGGDGVETVNAALCSLTCLLGWGQDYAAMVGMRVGIAVQQKIEGAKRLFETLKGIVKRP